MYFIVTNLVYHSFLVYKFSPDLKFAVICFDRSNQRTSHPVSVQDCADVTSHEIL